MTESPVQETTQSFCPQISQMGTDKEASIEPRNTLNPRKGNSTKSYPRIPTIPRSECGYGGGAAAHPPGTENGQDEQDLQDGWQALRSGLIPIL